MINSILISLLAVKLSSAASITTGFTGTLQSNGQEVMIKATSQPISIERFDINMDRPGPLEIWYLPDISDGNDNPPGYTMIFQDTVSGQGKGNVTPLPSLSSPVSIPAGETYTFYITVAGMTLGSMWYDSGTGTGNVMAQNTDIELIEAYALAYFQIGYTPNRRWNGNVYYSVGASPTTPNPTASPTTANPTTLSPTTSSPITASPTTASPTTANPTTSSPTTSSPTTASPTKEPDTSNPIMSPTETPAATSDSNDDGDVAPSFRPSTNPTMAKISTLIPSSTPTLYSEDPTQVLNSFLPKPTSSSLKKNVDRIKFCISALVMVLGIIFD